MSGKGRIQTYEATCRYCGRTFVFRGRRIERDHAALIDKYSCGGCARTRRAAS